MKLGFRCVPWALAAALAASGSCFSREVNIYSSRHYASDQAIYAEFTRQTGIAINRKEGKPEELLQLILAQGQASPADVFITVDAGNIWKAEQANVLVAHNSPEIRARVPANFREESGLWFGVAKRIRMIFVADAQAAALNVNGYADLADPRLKGTVCVRQSSNVYNLSLLASFIAENGATAAESWAKGVVSNMARPPEGGDTDQLLGVASGQCSVALANHYYFLRLARDAAPANKAAAAKLKPVFPDQSGKGAHANITAAGLVRWSPHPAEAKQFLEFLVTDKAQGYFADLTNEFPIVPSVPLPAPLKQLGSFKTNDTDLRTYGQYQAEAQKIYDRAGWK
jgi:iron(III) transport system substrate-binding protein